MGADPLCCSSPSRIAVHEEGHPGGLSQESLLVSREVDAQECHSWDVKLREAHDAPGAFHHHESLVPLRGDVVVTVEDLTFRQAGWELPFSVAACRLRIESPSGIAEGACLGIVEADRETSLQEPGAIISTGLEALCRIRSDPLLPQ